MKRAKAMRTLSGDFSCAVASSASRGLSSSRKESAMTVRRSRWHWVFLLAACAMPAIYSSAATSATAYDAEKFAASTMKTRAIPLSFQGSRSADTPVKDPAYFGDVPITVVGVYGATTIDMLSSGPLILVQWPDECCSSSQRWHTRSHAQHAPANATASPAHIFFLWPDS